MGELVRNNTIYWDTQEVIDYLLKVGGNGSTRESVRTGFYRDTRKRLRPYTFFGKSKPWYRKSEVMALGEGRLTNVPSIKISGILRDWTKYVKMLGLNISTQNCTLEFGASLPKEMSTWLEVPEPMVFIKRQRISFIDGVPIAVWSTYYPWVLASPFEDKMKQENDFDVVEAIKASRGITIKCAKDRYSARLATQYEQEILQLKRPDPILQLERAAYSELGKIVLCSQMSLLGSWFQPEVTYPVDIW